MILDIYKDSFEYGIKDGKTLLKLGLMFILSIFIIPIFLIYGYNYRIIKTTISSQINEDDPLPKMDDLVSMFVDGLKMFVVNFIYVIVPIVVVICLFFLSGFISGYSEVAGTILYAITVIVGIILFICSQVLMYLGYSRMIEMDSLSEAFNLRELYDSASKIGWLRFVAFLIGLMIIFLVIFVIVAIVLFLFFALLGLSIFSLDFNPFAFIGTLSASVIITYLVFALLVFPFISIVQYRAVGLLYNLRF